MPIIRNPFTRRQADEGLRPPLAIEPALKTPPGFERVDTVGSKASSALSVNSRQSQDTGEYKMSVVNDSGVYLPPSPTAEDKASWPRRYLSRTSTDKRSEAGDIEPFGISRESFDSYRRSFDITARSPIVTNDPFPTRRSMDSARFSRMPRQRLFERDFPTTITPEEAEGEGFEDVGLNDDKPQSQQQAPPQQSKKRGFFAKFSDNNSNSSSSNQENAHSSAASPTPMTSRFSILPGRKRGHSGQGAELGYVERPRTATREKEMVDVQPAQA
ncbi:hypothetical protein VP1G_10412 [Cytospora mali]|uniref:Uncharacterized protein n=1 Tax=Cytospora mali TaxID=578113 RepID=A0A194VHL7_CYTMA|nr:hypothetical protein VP1G_10412 [Valsa mali var. pyri (nom. inval.)]